MCTIHLKTQCKPLSPLHSPHRPNNTQTTLAYFSSLNCLQYHSKLSLLQPLLSYLRYASASTEPILSSSSSATVSPDPAASPCSKSATPVKSTSTTAGGAAGREESPAKCRPAGQEAPSSEDDSPQTHLASSTTTTAATTATTTASTTASTDQQLVDQQLKSFIDNCESGVEELVHRRLICFRFHMPTL